MANYPSDGRILVQTVEENLQGFSKREAADAKTAKHFQASLLGHFPTHAVIDILNSGVLNCPVMTQDVLCAERIYGPQIVALKGKTKRMSTTTSVLTAAAIAAAEGRHAITIDIRGAFLNTDLEPTV